MIELQLEPSSGSQPLYPRFAYAADVSDYLLTTLVTKQQLREMDMPLEDFVFYLRALADWTDLIVEYEVSMRAWKIILVYTVVKAVKGKVLVE